MKMLKLLQLCLMLVSLWCCLNTATLHAKDYIDIEWTQLMPADDLAALMNPPEFIVDIEDGTAQDSVAALSELSKGNDTATRFKEALQSSRVIRAFNDQDIRLPGFIVPLESDENQRVTAFFYCAVFWRMFTFTAASAKPNRLRGIRKRCRITQSPRSILV